MAFPPQWQQQPPIPQAPILLVNQNMSYDELFPAAATAVEMNAWFPNAVITNPITSAMPQTTSYLNTTSNQYESSLHGPFHAVQTASEGLGWVDDQENTVKREKLCFIIHHGRASAYVPRDLPRSISALLPGAVKLPDGSPNPAHWIYAVGLNGVPDLSQDWVQGVKRFLNKTTSDARGEMVMEAKKVWQSIDPQPGDHWYANAQHPGRLVSIMLFHLQNATTPDATRNTVGCIKWLLGGRLRSVLDVEALYSTDRWIVHDVASGHDFDVIPPLKRWLEFSCAHMLAEVFMCHYVGDGSNAYKKALAENFMYIAGACQFTGFLMTHVHQLPYKRRP